MNSNPVNPNALSSFLMKPASLAILSGILIGTSYIPFPPWAIFFCYVPLWICWLREKSWRGIFWTGWITQFVLQLIGFNWIAHTVHEFGHLPWIAAIATLLAFCSFANLNVPLAGVVWWWFCRICNIRGGFRIATLPLFMAAGERLFPMIFDWHLGYTWLWARFPAFQLADLVGFIGLSTLTFVGNGLLLEAWCRWRERRRWWPYAVAVVAGFALLNAWGSVHGAIENDAKMRFLVVQPNIGNAEKLQAEQGLAFRDTVLNHFTSLSVRGLHEAGPADFVVWPETAFPELIETPLLNTGFAVKLKEYIQASHTSLITGSYSRLWPSGKITNSFMAMGPNGEWLSPPYHKTMLLAFGEYLPLGDWLPFVHQWIPEIGDFGRGPGPTVLQAGPVKIGAQICYEGLFDWFARAQANKGAEVIVNLTNDSWYDMVEEPFQHGYMTLSRAIEVRRPLVRSTNTGLSIVALASGEIMEGSPIHEEWFHLYEVPYRKNPPSTIFMSWGYWLMPALMLICLLYIALRSRCSV